jgi:putative flippase GtrA
VAQLWVVRPPKDLMQNERPSPREVRRRVGQTMLLLYVGYLGLAVYLYFLIRGSVPAYLLGSALLGIVLYSVFRFCFRGVPK